MNRCHPDLINRASRKSIMKSLIENDNLPASLRKAAEYLEKGGTIPSLPPETVQQITEEEAKAQFVLRALSIARVFRAWRLMQMQDVLDALLSRKIQAKEFEKSSPEAVQTISLGVQGQINRELALINEEKKSFQNTISDLLKQIGLSISPIDASVKSGTVGDPSSRAKLLGIVGLMLEGSKRQEEPIEVVADKGEVS